MLKTFFVFSNQDSHVKLYLYSLIIFSYFQWFRAKVIQKLLIFLKDLLPINETIWSTKQILLYSRHHGYSPFCSQPKKQTTQPEEILSKRLRQDSSSDSDDEDSCSSKKPRFQDRFFNGAERKRNLKKGRRKAVSEGEPSSRINYRNLNTYSSDTIEVFGSEDMRVLASNSIPDIDVVSESVPGEKKKKKKQETGG